ncbi:MAG TPA: dockerin type I domain-containing protein, partial [Candidatus Udaeobacter sp.]|nr:dockerin type I domain-containing protein [Candidatus Udaeobacter sp.]
PDFNPGADSTVEALALQTDGKIVVAGAFVTLGGGGSGMGLRNKIGRLNADGTLDTGFDIGASTTVNALAIQPDGKIMAAGTFTTLGGGGSGTAGRLRIGRVTNNTVASQELSANANGTAITWTRGGASPELERVTLEFSTDGVNYTALTDPVRIATGWQRTGLSLPTQQNIFLRARGYSVSGEFGGSRSLIETIRNVFLSPAPAPLTIVSRKVHGVVGSFDIDLQDTNNLGIECRSGGANDSHQVVLTFPSAVTLNSAAVTSGIGTASSISGNGTTTLSIVLTGVANAQRLTLALLGLSNGTSSGNLDVNMGVLLGDTNGNGAVNASDVSQTKSRSGQTSGGTNFRSDVTTNGSINASDVSLVKLRSGSALPE